MDEEGKVIKDDEKIPLSKKQEILNYVYAHKTWAVTTIQKTYPQFRYRSYKKRWEDQIKNGGTEEEILLEIENFTISQFREARNSCKSIHDVDIKRWALQRSLDFGYKKFRAGSAWIQRFKVRNGIVSRKVQKFVNKKEIEDKVQLKENADEFRKKVLDMQKNYKPSMIWNSDQIGFAYEITDNRTLSWTGERKTFGRAFSPRNKATHSYTVQYVISMEGKIIGDAFVCLQEVSGRLGPNVEENLFPAPNLLVTCSHVKFYVEKLRYPAANMGESVVI